MANKILIKLNSKISRNPCDLPIFKTQFRFEIDSSFSPSIWAIQINNIYIYLSWSTPYWFICVPQPKNRRRCLADCNIHIHSDIHHFPTVGSWTAVGSLPSAALASECGGIFEDLWGCLWAAWKGHFADLWMTRLNDLWNRWRREKESLMLIEKTVFWQLCFCLNLKGVCPSILIPWYQGPSTVQFDRDKRRWRGWGVYRWISKKVTSSYFHKSSLTFICCKRCLCN